MMLKRKLKVMKRSLRELRRTQSTITKSNRLWLAGLNKQKLN